MLRAVLRHHLSQLVVHVLLDTLGRFFLLGRLFADDYRLDGASSRERLCDAFGLEANHRLGEHGVKHTAGAVPRLSAFLVLQAQ